MGILSPACSGAGPVSGNPEDWIIGLFLSCPMLLLVVDNRVVFVQFSLTFVIPALLIFQLLAVSRSGALFSPSFSPWHDK
jgi:hypothetical protein